MRRALRTVPRAAWLCALVAAVNAIAWSLITPAFQVPDEQAHTYYAQQLAETGKVPKPQGKPSLSPQIDALKSAAHLEDINTSYLGKPDWTTVEGRGFERAIRSSSPVGGGGDIGVGSYPPLYYATLAVPYAAAGAAGGSLIEKLMAMRVLSALYAGITVLFVFLFLRELLPRAPWSWSAGALACALLPMFAFTSGGVNPDSLLALCSAAMFYVLALAFRRGFGVRTGAALGGLLALACLAKLAALGLLPGAAVALAVLVWRAPPERRREAFRGVGAAAVVFVVPIAIYLLLNVAIWDRPLAPGAGGESTGGGGAGTGRPGPTLKGQLTYIWQLFLPALQSMGEWHPGFLPEDIWFRGWVGRFAWGSLQFDDWVYTWALRLLIALLAGAAFTFFRFRAAARRHVSEAASYAAIAICLVAFLGYVGYRYLLSTGATFEQARYLFPLLSLYGALVGVALAGLGRRWGAALAATFVVLAFAHDVAAVMLNVERFYA